MNCFASPQDVGFQANESNIELIVLACDAYGRFALHKQAALEQGEVIRLSPQARTLLDWTTDRLVPALTWSSAMLPGGHHAAEGELKPFPDLDLSRISTVSSPISYPFSPSPLPPPRQRANRNFTPKRLDASFEAPSGGGPIQPNRKSGTLLTESALVTANTIALALFQSSCILFSEWIALADDGTGASHDAEAICTSANKWFEILLLPSGVSPGLATLRPEVWVGLSKIAGQLAKVAKQFKALELLIKSSHVGNEKKEIGVVMRTCFSSLLAGRGDPAVTIGMVDTVVKVVMDEPVVVDQPERETDSFPF